jgi:hypothetical protein
VIRPNHLPACAHVEIGGNLQGIHDYLVHLTVELSNTYPRSSPQARLADQAMRNVDQLRTVMDSAASGELPEEGWSPSIYYGANEEMRQAEMGRVMAVHWAENPDCPCTRLT